jgi:hypothetical protein
LAGAASACTARHAVRDTRGFLGFEDGTRLLGPMGMN